jgi:hypothetical protein
MQKRTQRKRAPKTALARRRDVQPKLDENTPMGIIARLARDPKLTVDKLAQLIALNERLTAAQARALFEVAYDAMVLEIPTITKRGAVRNKQGEIQSRYSKFEDIQKIVKPILKRFGFTQKFRTEWPDLRTLEVVGILTHKAGHSTESRFRSPADDSGGKNAIQGLGSANAYGRRYTTIDLLNIVCEGQDDDGQAAGQRKPPAKPSPEKTAPPPAAHHSQSTERITDGQRRRLGVVIHNSGRGIEEVKDWLQRRYNVTKSEQITRNVYDDICRAIEAPGTLPEAVR